jgi:cyclase
LLLLNEDGLCVSTGFKQFSYVGDPINTVKLFNDLEVDELMLLNLAAARGATINWDMLQEIASEAFIPLAYGGGIKTLDDANRCFRLGFEKVVLNSLLFKDPELVKTLVNRYGSQAIVASLDYKKPIFGEEQVYLLGGKDKAGMSISNALQHVVSLGVGEVILQSIDRDGGMSGYDLKLIKELANTIDTPLVAAGGASSLEDMKLALRNGASAVAAGAFFVYQGPRRGVLVNYPTRSEVKKLLES